MVVSCHILKPIFALLDSLRDPSVESERFRQDLKTYLFAVGHYRDMSALEVSPFHGFALYKSPFTCLLTQLLTQHM